MIETKFKQTEVGLIPSDWELTHIYNVAADMADGPFGSNLKSEHYTESPEARVIQLSNIGEDGWHDENTKYTTFEHAKTLKRCIVKPGSILIAKMMPAGRAVICPSIDKMYILGSDVIRLENKNEWNADFIFRSFNSKIIKQQVNNCIQGSTRARISISKVREFILAYPPVHEQQHIAEALSDVDALISSMGKLIEKKRNIKLATMQQLLTGKQRLPGFTEPWVSKKIGDLGFFQHGSIAPYLHPSRYYMEYSMPSFDNGKKPTYCKGETMSSNRTPITGRLLLINKLNVRQKRIWLVNAVHDNSICSGEFLPFEATDCDLEYIKHLLLTDSVVKEWIDNSSGTSNSQKRVTPSYILNYDVYLPSDILEQKNIAELLTTMDNEIDKLETRKKKYEAIKQGMMQQLLTGKIRLTNK